MTKLLTPQKFCGERSEYRARPTCTCARHARSESRFSASRTATETVLTNACIQSRQEFPCFVEVIAVSTPASFCALGEEREEGEAGEQSQRLASSRKHLGRARDQSDQRARNRALLFTEPPSSYNTNNTRTDC
jgi:hypothetical protein